MPLETGQWALLALGAFGTGLSKTGIAGLGVLVVAVFAITLKDARFSVGVVLPILLSADLVAVTAYRRHADWQQLRRMFPWAGAGIVIGYLAMGHIPGGRMMNALVGGILLVLSGVQYARRIQARRDPEAAERIPTSLWFVGGMGLLAGFTTMVANAAGPILILYLLAMRLPKLAFMGTSAWYFLTLNAFKIPFSLDLGLINAAALRLSLTLAPFAVLGALCGRPLLRHIPQKLFEEAALALSVLAALRLLLP